jgi:IS30 family transposase
LNKDIKIQALVAAGNNQTEIAKILGKNKSVISCEPSRNRLANAKYKAEMASQFYTDIEENDVVKSANSKLLS